MLEMREWLNLFEQGRNLRISVWCSPEIAKMVGLVFNNQIHHSALCDYVKTTEEGLSSCMRCRACVDRYCARKGASEGYCVHGLYEFVEPVFFQKQHVGTVYVGNLIRDPDEAERRVRNSCKRFHLSEKNALALLSQGEVITDSKYYRLLGKGVAELMVTLLKNPLPNVTESEPPLVSVIKNSIYDDYSASATLKSIANEYHINEKYLGQIFKTHTGVSFAEYRNQNRLKRAADLLAETDRKIIDIALSVGYSGTSYFNRRFVEKYGISPTEYRRRCQKS